MSSIVPLLAVRDPAGFKNKNDTDMLKLIALLIMTIDHTDRILVDKLAGEFHFLTVIGRFAFPIFAFMIARNSLYTRNPGEYVKLLLVFGVLSQFIYWWALDHGSFWAPMNVLFTLALGVMSVRAWMAGPKWWPALPVLIGLGWFCEYNMEGVALMLVIAMTVHNIRHVGLTHPWTLLGAATMVALSYLLNISSYDPAIVIGNQYGPWVVTALALCFLSLLPPVEAFERNFRFSGGRLFFYAYYPGHLAMLGLSGAVLLSL